LKIRGFGASGPLAGRGIGTEPGGGAELDGDCDPGPGCRPDPEPGDPSSLAEPDDPLPSTELAKKR
jgi:hypothetical protein